MVVESGHVPLAAHHQRGNRGDVDQHVGNPLADIVFLATVTVAGRGKQNLGLDLTDSIHDRRPAEIGRAGSPDASDGDCRQKGDQRVDVVGHDAGYAVARFNASRSQPIEHTCNACP